MAMKFRISVEPTTEPVTLDSVLDHARITNHDDDMVVTRMAKAARQWVERITGRALCNQTIEAKRDSFDETSFELPVSPASSITHVRYVDSNGTTQNCNASVYELDTLATRSILRLAYNQSWPAVRNQTDAVTITYVAGYGGPTDVPEPIKHAIRMLAGTLYEHREIFTEDVSTDVPFGVQALLDPYVIYAFQ